MPPRISGKWLTPTCLTLVLLYLMLRPGDNVEPVQLVEPDPTLDALCDPFNEPGFLHYDPDQPMQTKWIPYSPSCEPARDWLSLIANRQVDKLDFLVNKTILVLGDSVDRNGLEHLAVMLGLPRYCTPYDDFNKKGFVPPGWDDRGIPWVIEIPWTGTIFTNGFFYGLDDEENFRAQPDWHPPGKAEDRVDQLFKPHSRQMPQPPSFISIHSGLWDLAFFGRQDKMKRMSTEIPLNHDRVQWWQSRMKHLIEHVRKTWPNTPIWMRKLHRVGPLGAHSSSDWRPGTPDDNQPVFSNFFTNVRVHQIREMSEQVAKDAGVPMFDFGEIWEGWQNHQQMVHPLLYPGGPVYAQALLHHIWMESVGRDAWRLSKRRKLHPVSSVDINLLD
ncbi:hypothetical protein ACM66B_002319 [Microbotryomycetes sp. NB124-2]